MLWLIALAGAFGFAAGVCFFRAPLLVILTFLMAVVCASCAVVADWLVGHVGSMVAAMSILQCGYLAGLFFSWACRRAKRCISFSEIVNTRRH